MPYFITLAMIVFFVYSYFKYYLIPTSSIWLTVLHLLLAAMTLWSLFAMDKSNPGYVKSYYEFSEAADIESAEGPQSDYKRFIISASVPLMSQEVIVVSTNNASTLPPGSQRNPQLDKIVEYRYCSKCNCVKPPRTHHCSVCKRCVLKMDHHCPFVNNCVGAANHKLFWVFLMYASLSSLQIGVCLLFFAGGMDQFNGTIDRP